MGKDSPMTAASAQKLDPYDLMREAMSQAVAEAMIPMRQEINAGIRQLDERVERIETDVSQLKGDMAEVKGDVSQLKTDVSQLKTDVAEMKGDIATIKELLMIER